MKRILTWFVVLVLALMAVPASAIEWQPLSVPEMAAVGATHYAEVGYADLTTATTNTAQAFTVAISAKTAVECVGMVMQQAFDTGNTNYTGSCALKVGDGSDDDLFLTSTELASDGSEVFVKFNAPNSATIASTPSTSTAAVLTGVSGAVATTANITYLGPGLTTNTATIVTAVSALSTATTNAVKSLTVASTATVGELGRKLYATAGNITLTFTPNSNEAVADNTAGNVRVYFRLIDYGR